MSQAQDDLVASAQDPSTPLATLHALAQNYPGLRPAIALNPSTYPALLEWLAQLEDPAVDAALRARQDTTAPQGAEAGLPPVIIPSRQPSSAREGATRVSSPLEPTATKVVSPVGTSHTAAAPAVGSPTGPTPFPPLGAGASTAQQAPVSTTPYGGQAPQRRAAHGGALPWIALLAAVMVLVAVLVVVFNGGQDPEPVAASTQEAATPAQEAPPAAPSAAAPEQPSPSPLSSPTPTPSKRLLAPAPAGAAQLPVFDSPSGNITCTLSEQGASCTIKERSFAPEACPAGNAYATSLTPGADPAGACAAGFAPSGTVLAYGQSAVAGDFACTSTQSAMICWNQATGTGFSLARQGSNTIDATQR